MKITDMMLMCLRNLWRRKGRTMLTIVGVVIGSCAVIVMISMGLAMSQAMDEMLGSWGDLTAVTIYNNNRGMSYDSSSGSSSSEKPKLNDDTVAMLGSIEQVSYLIPKMELDSSMVTVVAGRNDRYKLGWAQVIGVDLSLLSKMGYSVEQGELPDEHSYDKSLVMGTEVAYQFTDTKKHGSAAYVQKMQLADGSYTKPFIDQVGETIKIAVNNTKKQNDDGSYSYGGKGYEFKVTGTTVLAQDPQWETPISSTR